MANHGEWAGNYGYIAFATEAAVGTAVTPTQFGLITDETLTTNYNLEDQEPIFGNAAQTFQVLPGLRDHKGDFTMILEPNTSVQPFDMLLTRGTMLTMYTFTVTSANATIGATYTNNTQTFTVAGTIASGTTLVTFGTGAPTSSGTLTKATGTGDTTITFSAMAAGTVYYWPFTLSSTTLPKSKTVDISTGNVVKRFVGVQASKVALSQSKNQLMLKVSVSALGSFQGGVLASAPTGSGPYTVALDTTYDTNLTAKLVVGDLIRFYHGPSTTIDATIASIVDASHITTSTNVTSMAQGDMMYLRPQTPTFSVLSPSLWSNTQFQFGTTAALALAASQTRLEQGSSWEMDYNFESDSGSQRSGSADPASLVRLLGKPSLTIKKFFDTPDDVITFNQQSKTACVIRHLSYGSGNTYELRMTLNSLKTNDPLPKIKSNAVNYSEITFGTQYDQTDAAIAVFGIINGLSTIA